jgi:flagellar hook-length control protein FliK
VAAGAAPSARAVDQVASALVVSIRAGRSEATISLRPAALGEVRAQIISGQDGLVIRLSAERDSVGDLLRSQMGALRDALAGQQIAVSELHVLHNPPAAGNGTNDGAAWQQRPRLPQERDAASGGRRDGQAEQEDPTDQ